ncbi:MAG: Rrf2 family transcriptional regulator [Oscillibacter sp.]|jgi:Rrf2 family protein|nr:Rrf2 family transcriptional regulator [Oscillibacter sp.]
MTAEFPLAVHALVYLLHRGQVISSQELADNICTNPARVRKVLSKLHHAGLVEAERGQGSGYLTRPDAGAITLRAVLRALDETPVAVSWRSGDVDRACQVSSGMAAVMDGLYGQLNEQCEKKLETVTVGSINDQLFRGKEKEK